MSKQFNRVETKLIHAGEPVPRVEGAVVLPVFQTAMYEYGGESTYDAIRYIRLNNTPNHLALHQKLAALENAEAALVTASGMAAISTTLLTVLSVGDHLLAQDCLYGGTHDLITRDFASFGLSFDFIDADDPDTWKRKLRPGSPKRRRRRPRPCPPKAHRLARKRSLSGSGRRRRRERHRQRRRHLGRQSRQQRSRP